MDIRFLFLIIFAFVLEIFFLSKDLRFKNNISSINNIEIEFEKSKTYSIGENKINNILICDKIQQVKNKKLFFNPIATIYDKNSTKTILSKKAVLDDKTGFITLSDNVNVVYLNKKLTTDKLIYDLKKAIITDSGRFTLISDNIFALGEHLYFDIKNNIIKAENIKYRFTPLED